MKQKHSRELADEFRERVKGLPVRNEREEERTYHRKPGGSGNRKTSG